MEDFDNELAGELRGMVAGRAPNPPDSLLDFIETVTVTRKRSRAPIVSFGRVSLPGRLIGLATAAVLVAAVAGTALMLAGRTPGNGIAGQSSQPVTTTAAGRTPIVVVVTPTPEPEPTAQTVATLLPSDLRSEWTWKMLDNDRVQRPIAVPGGYITVCQGPTADKDTLCSSVDGFNWTDPADPRMLNVEGSVGFWPLTAVHVGSTYVALALQEPIPSVGLNSTSLWRSPDGHSWSKLNVPALAGLYPSNVGLLAGQFVTIASPADGKSTTLFSSPDGLTWSKLGDAPVFSDGVSFSDRGIFTTGDLPPARATWTSTDGHAWTKLVLPGTLTDLGPPAHLSDGTYVAIGLDLTGLGGEALVKSPDGINWDVMRTGLPGTPSNLTAIGDRLILTCAVGQDPNITYAAWQSRDKGVSWQSLPGHDGYPVTSLVVGIDGKVTTTTSDGFIWVGTLNGK